MEKCWLLMLVVIYDPSVSTCNFKDDDKVMTNYRHMALILLIWGIIIIYEHKTAMGHSGEGKMLVVVADRR